MTDKFKDKSKDIDEKKKTEEILKFHSMVLEQISDLVTVTDLKGIIQYVNQVQSEKFGLPKEEMIGKSIHIFARNPETGVTQDEIIAKTLKNGSWSGEVTNYGKDDKEYILKLTTRIVKDEKGDTVAMVGISSDITERKKAETELIESEKKFRRIYNNIHIGIARVSLDFVIMNANEAYCKMLGYTENELSGKTLKDITHQETLEENLEKQTNLGKSMIKSYSMEKKFVHKNGQTVFGILTANLIRNEKVLLIISLVVLLILLTG